MYMCEYVIVHIILPPSPVILWIELGGKPKWPPLNTGYHDVMRRVTSPIVEMKCHGQVPQPKKELITTTTPQYPAQVKLQLYLHSLTLGLNSDVDLCLKTG